MNQSSDRHEPADRPTGPPGATDSLAGLSPEQQRRLLAELLRSKSQQLHTFPMSPGQQGLWHAFRRDPTSTAFNIFLPTRVRSPLNLDALEKSFSLVARRHASLRTTFSDADGNLQQRVHPQLAPGFTSVRLDHCDDERVREIIAAETLKAFDLEKGPLLRILVYRLADDDWIVLALAHHIVVDFWSIVLILNEIRVAYPAFTNGREPQLPQPQSNYERFVRDRQALVDGERGKALRDYWIPTVTNGSPVVEIPTDFIRPAKFTGRAASTPLQLSTTLHGKINQFATEFKTTPFAIIHSALQVLIARYSGLEAFFIGSPFSGRNQGAYENTVGFFINMLPLQANVGGDPTFATLVARTTEKLLGALEHEDYPISAIVRDAAIARDPSRSPLFQISCTFEKSQLKSEMGRAGSLFPSVKQVWEFAGLKHESFYVPHPTCHYDLEFIFEQTDDALHGMLCYCRDLFDAPSMKQLATNFSSLIDHLLDVPLTRLSEVEWPVEQMPSSTPAGGQAAAIEESDQHTLTRLMLRAVEREPNSRAMQFDDQAVSFADLHAVATDLASAIRDRGVKTAELVPVYCQTGPAAVVGMFAVHLAGGAALPIDTRHPPLSLVDVMKDCRAQAVITDLKPDVRLDVADDSVLHVSRSLQGTHRTSLPSDPEEANSHDLAYVVYTSGSTGKPKGVMVEHGAVCNTLQWRMRTVPLSSRDRVLMLLSHQFDAGLGIAWSALIQNASLIWPDSGGEHDPELLIRQILRDQITVLPAIPSLLSVLIAHPRFAECNSLRMIFTGGEQMPSDLPHLICSTLDVEFWNFYGPTEAAIEAAACRVDHHDPQRPVPIGTPIANTELFVVDENRRVLPTGIPGELAIAGPGLARGYLNDSDLTEQKFVNLPRIGRVYLTGDRGRRLPSGDFEFLGRTDHQIKLRGYRIELNEIEGVLQAHPLVQRAAVTLADADTSYARLQGFVSLDTAWIEDCDQQLSLAADIRRFAGERLPSYKLPDTLQLLQQMPLTSSGKVDRKRLPEASKDRGLQILAPRTALEEFLADRWRGILKRERVGIDQSFFDAGGSSLQAAMLTNELTQQLQVHVPTSLLFDLADVARLAIRLVQLYPQAMTERFGAECIMHQLQLAQSHLASSTLGSRQDLHPLLAELKPNGSRSPIFMVHPPGGIVVCYRELANQLDEEQPLYAIRARGLHGDEPLPETLEAMAREYTAALRTIQPHGPYLLGGWSLGGLIAYEMAQQLLSMGEQVERLIMLDTTIPEGASDLVHPVERERVGREYGIDMTLEQLGGLSPEQQLPFLWEHAQKLGVIDEQSPPEVVASVLADLQGLFHHHVRLANGYHLRPLPVDVLLIRPQDVPFEAEVASDRGWGHLVQSVSVRFVPGHHHSMVQSPHVNQLAVTIQTALGQASENRS